MKDFVRRNNNEAEKLNKRSEEATKYEQEQEQNANKERGQQYEDPAESESEEAWVGSEGVAKEAWERLMLSKWNRNQWEKKCKMRREMEKSMIAIKMRCGLTFTSQN